MTTKSETGPVSRRELIKVAGSALVATGIAPAIVGVARAAPKTLKILQWNHFVPAFDEWFNGTFVKEWGERNGTKVIVENVGMTSLKGRAASEISKREGHDICMFLSPPAAYEDHVIDHREIYEEAESRYGKPLDLAVKSTFNPKTGKYFGFSDSYVPDPVNYRKDLWDDVGVSPSSWEEILDGGRKILRKHKIPVGIGLARELDTNMALRSVLAAFGASVQDANGNLALKSPNTLAALKFIKTLYSETMTDDVFTWDASSNNRFMLAGKGSLTLNAISITRTGETQHIPIADKIALSKPAEGPKARIGFMHLMNAYVIWNFAQNISGAKRFLVDLVGESRKAFLASKFYNFPCFPKVVPDLAELIRDDATATPSDKYGIFEDASDWTVNVGYPGYASAAIDEVFSSWLIPRMFSDAASGRLTPESALDTYAAQAQVVFETWRERGKI